MKRLTVIVILIGCLIATLSGCSEKKQTMTGRCLIASTGQYLIISDDSEVVVMSNQSEKETLFKDLQTGDKIKITCDNILLTYPGQTNVYSCKILENGSLEDIPLETYNHLKEMGWISE